MRFICQYFLNFGTQEMQDVGHAKMVVLQHGNGVVKYLIAWFVIAAYHSSGLSCMHCSRLKAQQACCSFAR